jgi:hypothetical protein
METQSSQRGIALAVIGILASLVLSILVAFQVSRFIILICAGATVLFIAGLYARVLQGLFLDFREERQRKRHRERRGLKLVADDAVDTLPRKMSMVYGYEEMHAVAGLRSEGECANTARIKPDRTKSDGYPYPLEIHIFDGEIWLVGYLPQGGPVQTAGTNATEEFSLWMRRKKRTDVLAEIPLSRVIDDESRGDRSWDSSARNIYRLLMKLKAGNPKPKFRED